MNSLWEQLNQAKAALLKHCDPLPKWALVLGSGFSAIADRLEKAIEIPYHTIPFFRAPKVQGHTGKLIIGKLKGKRLICLQGRLHYYEGHSMSELVFPVSALALAGVEKFMLTNASGSLHADWKLPALVLIHDHINLMGSNPLIGENLDSLGTRFPDLAEVYDPKLISQFQEAATRERLNLLNGVYVAVTGPGYETQSEVRMCRSFGADVIGMSTVPEAIALKHMGKKVIAISCASNIAAGGSISHSEVLDLVAKAAQDFEQLFGTVLSSEN